MEEKVKNILEEELPLPEGFDNFAEASKQKFIGLKNFKQNGGKVVGMYCSYVPVELIYAAGAVPVSLCATSEAPIKLAEKYLPPNLCPLIKASFGHAVGDTCPFFYFSDFIVGETTCDGKKKMFEQMNNIKKTHVMQLPQNNVGEEELEYWINETKRFKKEIEEHYGITITDEEIKKQIKIGNEERRNLIEFFELSSLVPSPITGLEQFNVNDSFGFRYDREQKNKELIERTKELKEHWEKNLKGQKDKGPRILITGCPLGGVKDKIIKLIEDLGAVIVGFDSCSGLRSKMTMIDEEETDVIKAVAEKYLKTNCAVMSPNAGRMSDIDYLIDFYKPDAVIEVTLVACHPFNIEAHEVAKFVKTRNLPYIHIESDFSTQDVGQIRTRVEAFLELVESR